MQERTRQRVLLFSGLLVVLLLVAWWYSGFSLEFMRFFAAEEGVTEPVMVQCAPATQTVAVGAGAQLSATGGAGLYVWYAPEGNPPDTVNDSRIDGGRQFTVTYAAPGTKKVTVSSPRLPNDLVNSVVDYVACTVIVTP